MTQGMKFDISSNWTLWCIANLYFRLATEVINRAYTDRKFVQLELAELKVLYQGLPRYKQTFETVSHGPWAVYFP